MPTAVAYCLLFHHLRIIVIVTYILNYLMTSFFSVIDFDIEEDVNCGIPPCCTHTWLSLPYNRVDTKQYCGMVRPPSVIYVSQVKTNIKFHTSKVVVGGRGFQLNYTVMLGMCTT